MFTLPWGVFNIEILHRFPYKENEDYRATNIFCYVAFGLCYKVTWKAGFLFIGIDTVRSALQLFIEYSFYARHYVKCDGKLIHHPQEVRWSGKEGHFQNFDR